MSLREQERAGWVRRRLVGIAVGVAMGVGVCRAEPRDLAAILEPVRREQGVPALAAAVVRSEGLVAMGVTGIRKAGSTNAVARDDLWHVGSLTKSMTATLAAVMVREGRVRWDSTLEEVFPASAKGMHIAWRGVTLEQLLSNHGGAPDQDTLESTGAWARLWAHGGVPQDQRAMWLTNLTAPPPQAPPGTREIYSNAGFTLAGHMLETTVGVAWEPLITARVFRPLGMASAGFGPPGTADRLDQPRGHRRTNGELRAFEPSPAADNPAGLSPAGTVHLSLEDLARYATFHLAGDRAAQGWRGTSAGDGLLGPDAFRKLHAAVEPGDYALGWVVLRRPWAGGRVLHHAGSNTLWYAVMWLAPERDVGFVALTNLGGEEGFRAVDAAVALLVQKYAPAPEAP